MRCLEFKSRLTIVWTTNRFFCSRGAEVGFGLVEKVRAVPDVLVFFVIYRYEWDMREEFAGLRITLRM